MDYMRLPDKAEQQAMLKRAVEEGREYLSHAYLCDPEQINKGANHHDTH